MADYWLKLYIEILDDPKMATLPDHIWRRIIEIFLVAKRLNKDGYLPETKQIAWVMRVNCEELEIDLKQITPTGIIVPVENGWFIPKFKERQAAVPDRERKAQERVRKQSQQYYGNVTDQSRNVTQSTEDREQKTEQNDETYFSANPLSVAFEKESHINAPGKDPRQWIDACNKMLELGIVESDVRQATFQLMKKGYTVVGPSSIVNAAINVMQQRKNNEPKPRVKVEYEPVEDPETGEIKFVEKVQI